MGAVVDKEIAKIICAIKRRRRKRMPNEYGEFVGVDSLHYAEVLRDDENAYIADTPQFLAPTAEIAGGATINSQPTYYG
jgi:hypothetical protein